MSTGGGSVVHGGGGGGEGGGVEVREVHYVFAAGTSCPPSCTYGPKLHSEIVKNTVGKPNVIVVVVGCGSEIGEVAVKAAYDALCGEGLTVQCFDRAVEPIYDHPFSGPKHAHFYTTGTGVFSGDISLIPMARVLRRMTLDEFEVVWHPVVPREVKSQEVYKDAGFEMFIHSGTGITRVTRSRDVSTAQIVAVTMSAPLTLLEEDELKSIRGDAGKHVAIEFECKSQYSSCAAAVKGSLPLEDEKPTAIAIRVVGTKLLSALPRMSAAMAVFQSIEALEITMSQKCARFTVPAASAPKVASQLHRIFIEHSVGRDGNDVLGRTYAQLSASGQTSSLSASSPTDSKEAVAGAPDDSEMKEEGSVAAVYPSPISLPPSRQWWRQPSWRAKLLATDCHKNGAYVYNLSVIEERAAALMKYLKPTIGTVFYAMKACSHPDVVRTIAGAGLGLECVSAAEIDYVRDTLGMTDVPILFTPNFCRLDEYATAFKAKAFVTIDGPDILRQGPDVFKGQSVFVRVDPGAGAGHSEKVVTAGHGQKFGHPVTQMKAVYDVASDIDCTIAGLHAHVGSGVHVATMWKKTGESIRAVLDLKTDTGETMFPSITWIDVGGGIGVRSEESGPCLDLNDLRVTLSPLADELRARSPAVQLVMEPGRFLVSEAGVLIAEVTQIRQKGPDVMFVGTCTGMNSLIRPALYGSFHAIYNLSKLDTKAKDMMQCEVVGPICETADVLGKNILLPRSTAPGDILIICNAGAYGRVMSSSYNMREPAVELCM